MVLFQHCFSLRSKQFSFRIYSFQCSFCVSNLIQIFQNDWVDSSTQYSLVIHYYCSMDYHVSYHPSCTSALSQLSILTMIYFILIFKSLSTSFLVAISSNCKPPSHHSILFIFHFSPFLTKIYYFINVPCVIGVFAVISHTCSRLSIQCT